MYGSYGASNVWTRASAIYLLVSFSVWAVGRRGPKLNGREGLKVLTIGEDKKELLPSILWVRSFGHPAPVCDEVHPGTLLDVPGPGNSAPSDPRGFLRRVQTPVTTPDCCASNRDFQPMRSDESVFDRKFGSPNRSALDFQGRQTMLGVHSNDTSEGWRPPFTALLFFRCAGRGAAT